MRTKKGKIPFSVSRNDARSLVCQVVDGLRQAIAVGFYRPGDVVPSYRELAPMLGVSRIVTQAALRRIADDGLVVSRPRIGSVVLERNARRWKGHVVFVCPDDYENYSQTVLAGTLRDRLADAGYRFTQVCLPQTSPRHYDFSHLDVALSQSVDLVVTMFARPHILRCLEKRNVPYAVFGEFADMPPSAVGGTWLNFNLAAGDFVAACAARGVRKVVELCWCDMCDAAPMLRQAGIGVRKMTVRPGVPRTALIDVKRLGMETFGNLIAENRISRDTVYFVADDYLASGALAALSYAGLHAPGDIRFVTYSNMRLGPVYPRELSRMEFDAHKAGGVLSDAVLRYLKTGTYPSGTVVGPVWIDGDTIGGAVGSPAVSERVK